MYVCLYAYLDTSLQSDDIFVKVKEVSGGIFVKLCSSTWNFV